MTIHRTHVLYQESDFTEEEYYHENRLALAVIDGGLSVCKKCGEYEAVLEARCTASNEYRSLDLRDRNFEDELRRQLESSN